PPPTTTLSQPPPSQAQNIPQHTHSASGTIDIEAWTISALQSLSVSPESRGIGGTPLAIPLDDHHRDSNAPAAARVTIAINEAHAGACILPPRRPPSRRDSMKRREALLKGKEGSRQRRRWDMARLTDVPNVEPPTPSDWEPRPLYPVHHIPYHVAQYWDRGLRQQVEEKSAASRKKKAAAAGAAGRGRVPQDLRATVKKSPGVKGWLRSLEEPVRQFLAASRAGEGEEEAAAEAEGSESDFSDDEIVFVGRKGVAREAGWKKAHREVHDRPVDRGMIFDSSSSGEDDESGAFKRWLTHSISDYYGLESRSVTMASPARKCVYIGIREADLRKKGSQLHSELPRPLWE
ncbi:hypothetical protein M406DRAFT_220877, partial [Cryphonectria parasitica EP155]